MKCSNWVNFSVIALKKYGSRWNWGPVRPHDLPIGKATTLGGHFRIFSDSNIIRIIFSNRFESRIITIFLQVIFTLLYIKNDWIFSRHS